jgi:endonuclease YncB( thermonuclease family)
MRKLFWLLLILGISAPVYAAEARLCTRVIDGATIEVDNVETVKLIGVSVPKPTNPNEPAEWFGNEAYRYTKQLVEGKQVLLDLGWPKKDRDGNTQAYVYLMDGTCINGEIIIQGYGYADRKDLFRYRHRYIGYEEIAREWNKGLWDEERKEYFEAREKLKREDPKGYEAYILGNYEASRRLGAFDRKGRTGSVEIVEPGTNSVIYGPEPERKKDNVNPSP